MKIVLLGAPGVGKGTAAGILAKKYALPHISTGDIFKSAIRRETPLGKKIKPIVEAGNLVPDELTNAVIKERLSEEDVKKGFFLDGYPRTIAQAQAMDSYAEPDLALNFIADKETIISRLSGRMVCTKCGEIFHEQNRVPKKTNTCDKCASPLTKRKDDTKEVILNRLEVHDKQTKPLIQYYQNQKKIININSNYGMDGMEKIIKQCEDALTKVK